MPLRPRSLLAALAGLSLCAMWAVPAQHLRLIALRELYRFGEFIGFTTTSVSGGRLAGQVMGFNYSEPPGWYHFAVHAMSAAFALAPALLPALWLCRRLSMRRRAASESIGASCTRAVAPLATAAFVCAALYLWLGPRMWTACLALGEWLAGPVTRISGQIGTRPGGPFYGDSTADRLANALVRWGPDLTLVVTSCAAAILVHAMLWRRADRAAARAGLCPQCGYDLRGLATAALCPECGARPATVEPGAAA